MTIDPGLFQVTAARVLNSVPAGILIAAFAWLLLRVVGGQDSRTRFAVWFVALVAIVALPFIPALSTPGAVAPGVSPEFLLPSSWAAIMVAVWSLITVVGGLRILYSFWRLHKVRTNSGLIAVDSLAPSLQSTIAACQPLRAFELRTSDEVRVPTALGLYRPAILLPKWSLQDLSTEELRAIILHEFAHLRRRDDWTNLAQKVLRAIFFFHPAVLWIENRLSIEREMACDDAVLSETNDPGQYARCLISLAEKSLLRRTLAMAQAVIGRAHETSQRLARILDRKRSNATGAFKPALCGILAIVGVGVVGVQETPRLIAFGVPAQTVATSNVSIDDSLPQLPKSMIVPAVSRETKPTVAKPKPRIAKPHPKRLSPKLDQQAEVLAQLQTRTPEVIPARVTESDVLPQYVVITQATDYFQDGSSIVSYSVLRVTFVTPRKQVLQNKAPNRT